jgi:3D (Asp-Asp-Asp) domain-containing protein
MNLIATALLGLFLFSGAGGAAAADSQLLANAPTYSVVMTGYNAVPAQTDSDPTTTASGAYSNPEIVAARSRDLADALPFGTVIAIEPADATSTNCGAHLVGEQIGFRVVADSMNERMRNKIDVLFGTNDTVTVGGKDTNAAIALGVCKVEIKVIGKIDIKDMPRNQAELQKIVDEQLLTISK